MLNTAELEQLVRDQVTKSVNDEIVGLLDNADWLNTVETSIISYAQQRVLSKFNNADSMQQILSAVESSVKTLFENGSISSIKNLVSEESISKIVNAELNRSVQKYVTQLFGDSEWINYVKSQVIGTFVRNLKDELKRINISELVKQDTKILFEQYSKTINYNGIDDRAKQVELSVLDGTVVVENELVSKRLEAIEDIETQNIKIKGDLILLGDVNTDATGWANLINDIATRVYRKFLSSSKESLVDDVIKVASKSGIDFEEVTVSGTKLVDGDTLSEKIINTNIQKVGYLRELTVLGEADFNNTAYIGKKRLGINTPEPSLALDVWDEEIEIGIGKISERTGFIGSNRKQNLQIGVNNKGSITVKDDGLVVIDQLQIGKHRFSHSNDVPGYSGSKGDIVFNIDVSPKNPVFAWMCIGGFNWVALGANIS